MNRISEMPLEALEQVFKQFLSEGMIRENMHNALWGMFVQILEDKGLIIRDPN